MGKKHPYYGKSMSVNFPDFPHTIGFVAFKTHTIPYDDVGQFFPVYPKFHSDGMVLSCNMFCQGFSVIVEKL